MERNTDNINEIKKQAEALLEDFDYVGIRTADSIPQIGDVSSVWDDGEKTDDDLDGICATDIEQWALVVSEHFSKYGYDGASQCIIAGNIGGSGEDMGELIIEAAMVIALDAE